MKRWICLLLTLVLLCGCNADSVMERALGFRSRFQGGACSFRATVSADYGDLIHTFVMDCKADADTKLEFTVAAPDTISGISGWISGDEGFLTFEQEILAISPMAEGQLTPVAAPWILINTLRGGYLRYASETDNGYRLTMDDSYDDSAMQVDIWLDREGVPLGAEILWQGRRILTVSIENFLFL